MIRELGVIVQVEFVKQQVVTEEITLFGKLVATFPKISSGPYSPPKPFDFFVHLFIFAKSSNVGGIVERDAVEQYFALKEALGNILPVVRLIPGRLGREIIPVNLYTYSYMFGRGNDHQSDIVPKIASISGALSFITDHPAVWSEDLENRIHRDMDGEQFAVVFHRGFRETEQVFRIHPFFPVIDGCEVELIPVCSFFPGAFFQPVHTTRAGAQGEEQDAVK